MMLRIGMFAATLLCGVVVLCAQQPPVAARIAGLEGNREYMSLLEEEARLQIREDSVVRAVEALRHFLRENPEAGRAHTDEILRLESRIFELRNAKGRLADRINTIEQEWVLANLDVASKPSSAVRPDRGGLPTIPEALKRRNLVENPCFRDELPEADYAALREAQRQEQTAMECVDLYFANHVTLGELCAAYDMALSEGEAAGIYDRFVTLEGRNRLLADSLAATWNFIFDNKSYAYGYLLDKFGQDALLAEEEGRVAEAARALSELRGATDSEAVADYFLRKRVLVDYETAVAGLLQLDAARDSLRGVAARLGEVDFRLPRHEIHERYFLDYDTLAFSKTPEYTYENPIPACPVYSRGTIYRILLGTFGGKRAASVFRGAYPLFYRIDEAGKWCYYAGGFATREEAEVAQRLCREHGFLRPEIVVWHDGVLKNLSRDGAAAQSAYRVEISDVDALNEELRAAIFEAAGSEVDISRAGRMFVVGTFDDRAVADRVADAVRRADATVAIKVAEIVR